MYRTRECLTIVSIINACKSYQSTHTVTSDKFESVLWVSDVKVIAFLREDRLRRARLSDENQRLILIHKDWLYLFNFSLLLIALATLLVCVNANKQMISQELSIVCNCILNSNIFHNRLVVYLGVINPKQSKQSVIQVHYFFFSFKSRQTDSRELSCKICQIL